MMQCATFVRNVVMAPTMILLLILNAIIFVPIHGKGTDVELRCSSESSGDTCADEENESLLQFGRKFVHHSSPETGFDIYDQVEKMDDEIVVRRQLRIHGDTATILSSYLLVQPENLSAPINPRHWQLDFAYIPVLYLRFMITALYAAGTFSTDESKTYKVLSLGLGGGSVNNYFRYNTNNVHSTSIEINPVAVKLAEDYFSFKADDRQECIIQDAAVYVKEAAEKGLKFDAIIIDACTTGVRTVSCPCKPLDDPAIAKYYSDILNESGMLCVNHLAHGPDSVQFIEIYNTLSTIFHGCKVQHGSERVIVCVKQDFRLKYIGTPNFLKKYERFWKKFGFNRDQSSA